MQSKEVKKQKARSIMTNSGLVYIVIVIITFFILSGLFIWLFHVSKENIIYVGNVNASSSTRDLEYLIERQKSEIMLVDAMIEKMIENGKSNQEILDYLISESEMTTLVLDGNYTGIYGYIRGEYLDGVGWEPEEGYDPKSRPWYTSAKKMKNEVALVTPYRDAQTGAIMMSYSMMLKDQDSVVSLDFNLDGMQRLVSEIADKNCEKVIVMDREGFIIADSKREEVGLFFNTLNDDFSKALYEVYQKNVDESFEFHYKNKKYFVFNQTIHNSWKSLILVDSQSMFSNLRTIYISAFVVILGVIAIFMIEVNDLNKRRRNAERISTEMERLFMESNTDTMTGFFNRRAYENALQNLPSVIPDENFVYAAFDINGLKYANDNLGHEVGDELIKVSATCIKECFENYGHIYRVGGDEFIAIIHATGHELTDIKERFQKKISEYSGITIKELSISVGYAPKWEYPEKTVSELAQIADQKMYEAKDQYYKETKKERRI